MIFYQILWNFSEALNICPKITFGNISFVIILLIPFSGAPYLTDAVRHVSETYQDIGVIYEEEPKYDWDPLQNLLYEYRGVIDGFPSIISAAKVIIETLSKCMMFYLGG